ncbi:hypothetical protein PPYR_02779 [Photinus pyralis]|uniref:Ribosomal RNA processing protein 1 homolog n=1 Tax=Photinus pyralis TaxID=7054 RepID=A0A5N4A104_PHOPY|nr:ribosomal RNA processing protein 1 homolog [Photinus pyralis]KAB0790979.1 hypothetical protein PPYR_02779 [Photinus pyralis]
MANPKKTAENVEKRKLLCSQDLKFVRALAGNEQKIRDRALKNLREWLPQRSMQLPFEQEDLLRIWKGLFTTMWMSDKPLVQEECAESIANLIHHVDADSALLFFKCGLTTMAIEWFGIDQWRLDKFLMLVRRMLRHCFQFLKSTEWNMNEIESFNRVLEDTLLKTSGSSFTGLTMHFTEIFLEELAKVSNGKITQENLLEFLKPFAKHLASLHNVGHIRHLTKCIFDHLMQQSDAGFEYEARFSEWKRQGFPGGSLDAMERMEIDLDDEEEEDDDDEEPEVLDPRAGHVDVVLPQLKFDPSEICELLNQHKLTKQSTKNGRKAIAELCQKFAQLTEGDYPLGIKEVPLPEKKDFFSINKSLDSLSQFERQLRAEKKKLFSSERVQNGDIASDDVISPVKLRSGATINGGIFADKLKRFIKKSEGRIKKRKLLKTRKRAKHDALWAYENAFVRNSGLWEVHRFNSPMSESPLPVKTGSSTKFAESEIVARPAKPKRQTLTAKNEKKVRIALKLNQSQEIHEHVAQLKSSPGIPYDANRLPEKPLLKPNAIKSPINPFYKRKMKF